MLNAHHVDIVLAGHGVDTTIEVRDASGQVAYTYTILASRFHGRSESAMINVDHRYSGRAYPGVRASIADYVPDHA